MKARIICSMLVVLLLVLISGRVARAGEKSSRGKILVVVSSQRVLTLKGGQKHPTGYFLNELGVPIKTFVDAGFEPVFSDPLGNEPAMDTVSDKPTYFGPNAEEYKAIKRFVDGLPGLKHPQRLSGVAAGDLNQYAGIFIPGGHAPMEDLWKQPALGKILKYFHRKHRPTALICHGPIALLSTLSNPEALVTSIEEKVPTKQGGWCYSGYHMTVFSDLEEKSNEAGGASSRLGGQMRFYPEDALNAAGADVGVASPKQSHVVKDRELITGQNPFSDKELAAVFVTALTQGTGGRGR